MTGRLVVHLGGRIAGHFSRGDADHIDFSYSSDWVDAWRVGQAHQISVSLPASPPDVKLTRRPSLRACCPTAHVTEP